jgi:anti-anti-sigma factor
MALQTTVDQAEGRVPITVLTLDGELDGSNYQHVIDTVTGLYDGGARHLVLDLSDLTFISSAGLVALHTILRQMQGVGPVDPDYGYAALRAINDDVDNNAVQTAVHLCGTQDAVQKVLDRTGLGGLFPTHPDRATAIAAF